MGHPITPLMGGGIEVGSGWEKMHCGMSRSCAVCELFQILRASCQDTEIFWLVVEFGSGTICSRGGLASVSHYY